MSADTPLGLTAIIKVLGVIFIIMGAIITLNSIGPLEGDISHISGLFTVAGLAIVGAGLLMLIAKNE
jgi:hypothetical protein